MKTSRFLAAVGLVAFGLGTSQVHAGVVESFDTGAFGPGWVNAAGNGTVNAAAAHDGGFGVTLTAGDGTGGFTYNPSITIAPGDTLSAWVRPSDTADGRVYLGFGASAAGTQSFVSGDNTSQLIFQNNTGFGFTDISSTPQTWISKWYLMQIDWTSATTATGTLFDSDGTTVLNTLSVSGLPFAAGGISLRGFGGWDLDTVCINCEAAATPEPGSMALLALGLAGLGFGARKRKRA